MAGSLNGHTEPQRIYPAWIRCPGLCDDYVCTIHGVHVWECECPELEEWGDTDPYSEGGQSTAVWGMSDEEYDEQMRQYDELEEDD